MLSTCLARYLRNSNSNIEKISISPNNGNTQEQTSHTCAANKARLIMQDCEVQPVKESEALNNPETPFVPTYIPPAKSESVDSQDLAMINIIREMACEEQRLSEEVKELNEKEQSFKKAMELCSTAYGNQADMEPDSPEVTALKDITRDLQHRNNMLKDNLADAKLELKQLKEVIAGPLKRELERARRQCMECQCKYNELDTNATELMNSEVAFLKEQLQNTCCNITDIHAVNAEIRQEVLVLNHKCQKLQELLIKNKVEEMNTLKQLSDCTCNGK